MVNLSPGGSLSPAVRRLDRPSMTGAWLAAWRGSGAIRPRAARLALVAALTALLVIALGGLDLRPATTRAEQERALFAQTIVAGALFTYGQAEMTDAVVAPDAPVRGAGRAAVGPGAVRDLMAEFDAALPWPRLAIAAVTPAGDVVTVDWTWQGTMRGPLLGIAPPAEPVALRGSFVIRVEDGTVHALRASAMVVGGGSSPGGDA